MDEKFIELAKRIEKQVAELSAKKADDEKTKAELTAKLEELGEKQAELARKILTAQQESKKKGEETHNVSLGAQFVNSQTYADFLAGKLTKASLAAASPVMTPTGVSAVPPHNAGIVGTPELPNTVADSFTHVQTTSNMVVYLREKEFANNAAEVAEGADKPESKFEPEEVEAGVKTIAHFIRVTKQLAEDAPALRAYIDARMSYGLARRIETQLINGDGASANISGLLKTGNYIPHGFTKTNLPANSTELDLIRRCAATMDKTGYHATHLYVNPMDFDTLRGMKDSNGNYLMGSPLSGRDVRPWGLSVVQSAAMPEGKFLVADPKMGGTIYDRQGITIEMFEQDANNVTKNLLTIRAECRLAFAIDSVNCFIGGDLKITDSGHAGV